MIVGQVRYYGDALNNQDGAFYIEYRQERSAAWETVLTPLPTNLAVWTGWLGFTLGQVVATEMQVKAGAVDSSGLSRLAEVEFKA